MSNIILFHNSYIQYFQKGNVFFFKNKLEIYQNIFHSESTFPSNSLKCIWKHEIFYPEFVVPFHSGGNGVTEVNQFYGRCSSSFFTVENAVALSGWGCYSSTVSCIGHQMMQPKDDNNAKLSRYASNTNLKHFNYYVPVKCTTAGPGEFP